MTGTGSPDGAVAPRLTVVVEGADPGTTGDRLDLTGLAPGSSRSGTATVTTPTATDVQVWAVSPADLPADLVLTARLCRTPWQDDACPDGALEVPLDGSTVAAGVLDPASTWQLRVDAMLPLTADDSSQEIATTVSVHLGAFVTGADDLSGAVLAGTGGHADVLAVLVPVALVLAGAALRRVRTVVRGRDRGPEG